jgi:hypothetical protein
MAKKAPVHVMPHKDGWAVIREGNKRPRSVYRTQSEAAKQGRTLAQEDKTEFILHGRDGHIRWKRSYEADAYAGRGLRSQERGRRQEEHGRKVEDRYVSGGWDSGGLGADQFSYERAPGGSGTLAGDDDIPPE